MHKRLEALMTRSKPMTIVGKTFALDRHRRGWALVVVRSIDPFGTVWVWDEQQGCEYPVHGVDLKPASAMEPKPERKRASGPVKSKSWKG